MGAKFWCGSMKYMVLVPPKPTKSMLHAAAKALSPGRRPTKEWVSVDEKHRIRYEAMIKAYVEDFPDRFVAVKDGEMRDWMPIETRPDEGEFLAYDPISGKQDVCYATVEAVFERFIDHNSAYPGILGSRKVAEKPSCSAVQFDGEYDSDGDEFQGSRSTHWMPLPPPPNNAKVAEGEK